MRQIILISLLVGSPIAAAVKTPVDQKEYVPLGSRIPRLQDLQMAGTVEAQRTLRQFSRCVAKTKRTQVLRFVSTYPDAKNELPAINAIIGQESACLYSKMTITSWIMRGAISEELYKIAVPIPASFDNQPMKLDQSTFMKRLYEADDSGVDKQDAGVHIAWWMSYCTVHENTVAVDSLLRTKDGAPEEKQAFQTLLPIMERCLSQGQKIDFDRMGIRGFLANALYRKQAHIGEES